MSTTCLEGKHVRLFCDRYCEIRWRVVVDAIDVEWDDILDEVNRLAGNLDWIDHAAWCHACEAGRGPDADADAAGWRHVANEQDWQNAYY